MTGAHVSLRVEQVGVVGLGRYVGARLDRIDGRVHVLHHVRIVKFLIVGRDRAPAGRVQAPVDGQSVVVRIVEQANVVESGRARYRPVQLDDGHVVLERHLLVVARNLDATSTPLEGRVVERARKHARLVDEAVVDAEYCLLVRKLVIQLGALVQVGAVSGGEHMTIADESTRAVFDHAESFGAVSSIHLSHKHLRE